MRIPRQQLESALSILEANGGKDEASDFCKAISALMKEMDDRTYASIIDEEAYIAGAWKREDIADALQSRNIPATDENIDAVIGGLDLEALEDRSPGLNEIYDTIDSLFSFREYTVLIPVTGRYAATVTAKSEAEAVRLANEMCESADFGDLEDIDWEDGKIAGVRHIN